jgi:hypothetical protein
MRYKKLVKQTLAYASRHKGVVGGIVGVMAFFLMPKRTPTSVSAPLRYITTAVRDAWYGPITYVAAPTSDNPEAIKITNDFHERIIRHTMPILGPIEIHELAAPSLYSILNEIAAMGWGSKIRQFNGSFVPRFVRGSTSDLSSHSYGTSIDINAAENPQGGEPTADQRDLATIFEKHGWYWGDRFSKRDPMHFEFVLENVA